MSLLLHASAWRGTSLKHQVLIFYLLLVGSNERAPINDGFGRAYRGKAATHLSCLTTDVNHCRYGSRHVAHAHTLTQYVSACRRGHHLLSTLTNCSGSHRSCSECHLLLSRLFNNDVWKVETIYLRTGRKYQAMNYGSNIRIISCDWVKPRQVWE